MVKKVAIEAGMGGRQSTPCWLSREDLDIGFAVRDDDIVIVIGTRRGQAGEVVQRTTE